MAAVEAAYEGEDRERKVKAYLERAEEACRVKKEVSIQVITPFHMVLTRWTARDPLGRLAA